ncbi:MAG TPA: DUF1684 domain-containing protein, partial [Bacteroidales bacterium]|nr:DUF1684 domain-containing protein [Bacteroidales bacterium]
MKNTGIVIAIFLIALSSCHRQPPIDPDAYVKEIDQWHSERLDRLKDKNGWLSLAGLYWLQDGLNTFGSDTSNGLVFPKYAPPFIGTLELKDSSVYLQETVQPVLIDSLPASHVKLVNDMAGKPTRMILGRYAWSIIKRGDRFGVRLRDYESSLPDSLDHVPSYETNEKYRVVADFKPFDVPEKQVVHTVIGTDAENIIPGVLIFRLKGKKYKLYPVASEGEWSIVFGDLTNGEDTYDAGRYLDIPAPDENNKVIVDFNKA